MEVQGTIRCPGCGAGNSLANRSCRQCGGDLAGATPVPGSLTVVKPEVAPPGRVRCPACQAETPGGFPFCQYCGGRLGSAPKETPEPAAPVAQPPVESALIIVPEQQISQRWAELAEITSSGQDGQRFPIDQSRVVIGRSGDIVVSDDFVARQHVRLEKTEGGCRVEPIDRRNGVFLRLTGPTEIEAGDVMLLGSEVLMFEWVADSERKAEIAVSHGVSLFGTPQRRPWGRLVQMVETGAIGDIRHLHEQEVTIGRETGPLLFASDDCMSRRHATLSFDGDRCTLTDLGSANGTYLRLREACTVADGAILRLGSRIFRLNLT